MKKGQGSPLFTKEGTRLERNLSPLALGAGCSVALLVALLPPPFACASFRFRSADECHIAAGAGNSV